MPYQPVTNFKDSNGVDLGSKLVTKDYLLSVYSELKNPPVDINANLWTWGYNNTGPLGNANTTDVNTPVTTFADGTNWKTVAGGWYNTASLKTDGTLWVWGWGQNGNLGNNSTTNRSTPVTTFSGGTTWRNLSYGQDFGGAIKTDGTLWVWGNNVVLQLGINVTPSKSTPVTTFSGGTNWRQISCSNAGMSAIKTDGTLWAWGDQTFGILGNARITLVSISTPVTTFSGGTNWKIVCGGGNFTSAIKTDGTLWTWGFGNAGRLGNANTTDRSTPVTTFSGGTNWRTLLTTCSASAAAIKTDGTLWVWGYNGKGQLGVGDTIERSTPVTTFLGGNNWKSIYCGSAHLLALKSDGTLWIWGNNAKGQLGVGDSTNRSTPVTTFINGANWKSVGAGFYHTIGIESIDFI